MKIPVTGILVLLLGSLLSLVGQNDKATLWHTFEIGFTSDKEYGNPLYDISEFSIAFTSPTGREKKVNGFWDGGRSWKMRFQPDERGDWFWKSTCSDKENAGLHARSGQFSCVEGEEELELYQHGAIKHIPGKYYLTYADGTPFFWMACTAWNGGLNSTVSDWDYYLKHRRDHGYNVIQFVTTQWRGGDSNRDGEVAFTGSGRIEINPQFFQKLDEKVHRINEYGLVAAPVLLWALPSVTGRQLSPGYYLPVDEAAKLASYIVARYQGNQVVWFLGGDGRYFGEYEDRWKAIGRKVFDDIDHAPATLHPHGQSYVGDLYGYVPWYQIMGYQSSHNYTQRTVDFINRKEVANNWGNLRPMPHINLEPLYENIHEHQTPENVRNAIWWSLFATPVAGVTYGANGIWSWIQKDGDPILNHRVAPWTVSWKNSLKLPVSQEMKHLVEFWKQFEWWELYPDPSLLVEQPGDKQYDAFVGVLSNRDQSQLVAYIPKDGSVTFRNTMHHTYKGHWFNPQSNEYSKADLKYSFGTLTIRKNANTGLVLVLTQELL